MPVVLAGPVQPGQEEFFRTEIDPHLDDDRVRYVGEVGGAVKQRLFASARALLMPIRWAEPFGMVMVEALSAGTPVIAFSEGAAPEIVDHGTTGYLVDDEEQMARAIAEVHLTRSPGLPGPGAAAIRQGRGCSEIRGHLPCSHPGPTGLGRCRPT